MNLTDALTDIATLRALPGPAHQIARHLDLDTPGHPPLHVLQCRCGRLMDEAQMRRHLGEVERA